MSTLSSRRRLLSRGPSLASIAFTADKRVSASRAERLTSARTGKPQCEGPPDWPRYSTEHDQLLELGSTPRVLTNHRKSQLDAQENAMQDVIDEARKSIEDLVRGLASD